MYLNNLSIFAKTKQSEKMINCKMSKEKILEKIESFKLELDEKFLRFCKEYGDDHEATSRVFEHCRTLNELVKRIEPAPKSQYKKKGASKILKNINQ